MHPVREECADPGGVLIIEVLQQLLRSDAKIFRELLKLRACTESLAVVLGELLRDRGPEAGRDQIVLVKGFGQCPAAFLVTEVEADQHEGTRKGDGVPKYAETYSSSRSVCRQQSASARQAERCAARIVSINEVPHASSDIEPAECLEVIGKVP